VHHVYVLRSLKNGKRYVGSTGQDVSARLRQHNRGQNRWAAQNRPFKLVRVEEYDTKAEAVRRERFLKTGVGRRELDLLLQLRGHWFNPPPEAGPPRRKYRPPPERSEGEAGGESLQPPGNSRDEDE